MPAASVSARGYHNNTTGDYTPMRSLTLLVFPAIFASGVATAQEQGTTTTRALDEVVVTAQRREQLLQQTPVAVTALTRAEIEDQLITTTQDIGKTVPNLQIIPVTANPSAFQVGLPGRPSRRLRAGRRPDRLRAGGRRLRG